ncbi:zinc finger protein 583-like isoform X2 [Ambystoma mexicanum]|uniref:zinc finger protein 583-like isoform X2 n=1 Tax=Ambystoma mexicanum TaxID=8296 RepID=UPI0037E93DDE
MHLDFGQYLWKDMAEAPVSFHDPSSCFSDQEWKLLQEWQKELYRNVMKEIHQALISLGPLIASTVFSLITKEKEELMPTDNGDSERRDFGNNFPGDGSNSPGVLLGINRDLGTSLGSGPRHQNQCLNTGSCFDTEICLKKEEPPCYQLGEKVGESSSDTNLGHEFISFCIKREEDKNSMGNLDCERRADSSCPRDDGPLGRIWKAEGNQQSPEHIPVHRAGAGTGNTKVLQRKEMENICISHPSSENDPECGEKTTIPQESGFMNTTRMDVYEGNRNTERSDFSNEEYWMNASRGALSTTSHNTLQNWSPFLSAYSEPNLHYRDLLLNTQKPVTLERPYQCTECYKSFARKQHFIVHLRTHTGEKPYQCSECKKTFSQMHNLSRHQRLHGGEKPHQCTECGKCFSRKYILIGHQRLHKGKAAHMT